MAIKKRKPTTSSQRFATYLVGTGSENRPHKPLLAKKTRSGGRENRGMVAVRHRGGGHKRRYRIIDFRRDKIGIPATVETIEYDPNRSANIALLCYRDGERRYILAPDGLKVGGTVVASVDADIIPGNALPLRAIPLGTQIHNIELRRNKGGQLVRSAGGSAQLLAREGGYAQVRLPSGEEDPRRVLGDGRAGRQPRSRERQRREGRSHAVARQEADRTWRGHEPRGPSPRRRRGQELGRTPSGDAVGRPDQG
jgi:large subunit ribosomal protein L2